MIGKIGEEGEPFQVGKKYRGIASTSGELQLGVNDEWFVDNSGTWHASIEVTKKTYDNIIQLPQVDDIIIYRHRNDPVHAGIVMAVNSGKVTEVISKFGQYGTFLHKPNDIYKNDVWEIWHTNDASKFLESKQQLLGITWWADNYRLMESLDYYLLGNFPDSPCKTLHRAATETEQKIYYDSKCGKSFLSRVKEVNPPNCSFNCFGYALSNNTLFIPDNVVDKLLIAKHFSKIYVEVNLSETACPVDY